jgi:hypothetical protein
LHRSNFEIFWGIYPIFYGNESNNEWCCSKSGNPERMKLLRICPEK